jgi:hypothetical protein
MHRPFHVHCVGRVVVSARDGRPEPNLVWKDIAQHHDSGVILSFDVLPADEA